MHFALPSSVGPGISKESKFCDCFKGLQPGETRSPPFSSLGLEGRLPLNVSPSEENGSANRTTVLSKGIQKKYLY